MKEDEISSLANDIAEETFKLFSERFDRTMVTMEKSTEQQQAIILNLVKLDSRLKVLEKDFVDHINNFKTVAVESERLITEKCEELNKKDETYGITIAGEIPKLTEAIVSLNNEINKLKLSIQKGQEL